MATKLQKTEAILDYLLNEQYVKLNVPTLKKIIEIDPKFDLNRFDIKRIPMTIMYSKDAIYNYRTKETIKVGDIEMRQMNTSNCYEEKIYDMTGFKIFGSDKLETDLNLFFRRIDDVSMIQQQKMTDWKNKIYSTCEYQVKYLPSKKNIKTFRFVLHSYSKKAHNLSNENRYRQLEDFYINGNSMKREDWKRYSREYKLKRVLKTQ